MGDGRPRIYGGSLKGIGVVMVIDCYYNLLYGCERLVRRCLKLKFAEFYN